MSIFFITPLKCNTMQRSGRHERFRSWVIGLGTVLVLVLLVSGCTQKTGTPAGTTVSPAPEVTTGTVNVPGGMGLLARPPTAVQTIVQNRITQPAISYRPPACSGTLKPCGGSCIDTASDADNCGACGKACLTYPNMNSTCSGGTCGYACFYKYGYMYQDCNKNTADGCEVNLFTDKNNCGSCGKVCGDGLTCFTGTCKETWGPVGAGTYNPPSDILR